ncbi:MAG: thioredoxin family protein [Microthrixaceae bacterium]
MARTESTMMPLGTQAPPFELKDPEGRVWSTASASEAPGLLVAFLCNHCPFVIHIGRELGLLTQRWAASGLAVVGINSNDAAAYPDDAPQHMGRTARSFGWDFPYLVDGDASVAAAFDARCTPDFFLFDGSGALAYRGRFDAARPGNDVAVTGSDLRRAVQSVLEGGAPDEDQFPSMGCSIKWPPGTGPDGGAPS